MEGRNTKSRPTMRLLYFNIPGKAEPLRLLMNHAGLEFEDYRFESRDEFMAMKQKGELNFGQVPALEIGGSSDKTLLVQTAAIARYIGRIAGPDCGLYPEDPLKAAAVDAIVDQVSDMMCCIVCAKYQDRFGFDEALGGPDGEGTKKVEQAIQTTVMPRHLSFFEALLTESSTGWLANTPVPTIADFVAGVQLYQLASNPMVKGAELLPKYPKIVEHTQKLMELPSVKAWYAKQKLA